MVVSLEFGSYGSTDSRVTWADNTIKNYPNHKIIIVNHEHNGGAQWLAKRYKNVILILKGHSGGATKELKTGNNGNKYGYIGTCFHHRNKDTYLGVVELDTVKNTVSVKYYSPYWKLYGNSSGNHIGTV